MKAIKHILEKPFLIWLFISIAYLAIAFGPGRLATNFDLSTERNRVGSVTEQETADLLLTFSKLTFPPDAESFRTVPDWGHLGYTFLVGQSLGFMGKWVSADSARSLLALRCLHMAFVLAAFFLFVSLGYEYLRQYRLNPMWISIALLLLAANPYFFSAATHFGYLGLFLCLVLAAALAYEFNALGWYALWLSLAVLVDFRALLVAGSIGLTRLWDEGGVMGHRLLRPERIAAFATPILAGVLPLVLWQGPVPQGVAQDWWRSFRETLPLIRMGSLSYWMALLPVYGIYFSWTWVMRARRRAVVIGAIVTALVSPFYFVFPIYGDYAAALQGVEHATQGWLEHLVFAGVGPYKNLLLFIPWAVSTFLFSQLVLMDILQRSRWLQFVILSLGVVQPFILGLGDAETVILLPFVFLFTLSEGLVGHAEF